MTLYVLLAGALAAATLLLVVWPLLAPGRASASRAAKDAEIFRDQLAELERDRERGLITDEAFAGAKAEVSRRLIAADDRARAAGDLDAAPRGASRLAAIGAAILLPAIALGVYLIEGAPGLPDQPFAERGAPAQTRLAQAEAEEAFGARERTPGETEAAQRYATLVGRLEQVVANRPEDVRGRRLLSKAYMRMTRFDEAWRSFDRLIEMQGAEAPVEDYADKAEAMVLAAGGYVSREAEGTLTQALLRDPSNEVARYYQGIAEAQKGRFGRAVAIWERLRADIDQDSPIRAPLEQMLARANSDLAGAGANRGPSQADLAAAAEMSPEERQAMIEGMVAQLDTRLAEEGGTPEEWVRLLTVLNSLGRQEDARAAFERSQTALDGSAATFVREQALLLGIVAE